MGTKTLLTLRERLQEAIGDHDLLYAGNYTNAINNAGRELYPLLFRHLKIDTLVAGNPLKNAHVEDWSSTSYPNGYALSSTSMTVAEETTEIWGGASSAKVTRAGTDCYMYCSITQQPRLLNLMGRTITFHCAVKASTASQAYIEIYTLQADGTAQTETSDAHSGDGEFEILEIEDFALNDDLVDLQFRFKVITADGSAYFDNAWVSAGVVYEYELPLDFQDGVVTQVYIQTSGSKDEIADDISLDESALDAEFDFKVIDKEGTKYLRLPCMLNERKLRLIGYAPLEDTLSADADTMTIENPHINLLIARAAHLLYEMEAGVVSSGDRDRLRGESQYWYAKSKELEKTAKMILPQSFTRFR